jgi:D-amino-acid dehydrogenase
MKQDSDVIVLGAGIVGVSIALHLQERGRTVLLVDRGEPGGETSHGNAGLIERSSVVPYAFPRDLPTLLAYATNRSIAVRYNPATLLRLLPWLARYWWHSAPERLDEAARAMLPLIELCMSEHARFTGPAGTQNLMRDGGWIELYRSDKGLQDAAKAAEALKAHKLLYDVLDGPTLKRREPSLIGDIAGGVHWRDPMTVSDPGAVTRAYAALFAARGGRIEIGDAQTLRQDGGGWHLSSSGPGQRANEVVVALGPWSADLCQRLGYNFPLAYKRGYHMHYEAVDGALPLHPICDAQAGFVLSSMERGIRLTTGIELAERDAPSDPWQLDRAEQVARRLMPLGRRLDAQPWRGARPCLPDMLPVIGKAPRHDGLWFAFGHAHHGFTLGPVTGRLVADLMTGTKSFTNAQPYSPARFVSPR